MKIALNYISLLTATTFIYFLLSPCGLAVDKTSSDTRAALSKSISDIYARADRLVEAAWGFSLSDGSPLRSNYDMDSPARQPVLKGASYMPPKVQAQKKRQYRLADDYDYKKDNVWKKEATEIERQFKTLIAEIVKKEGPTSRTAAKLKSHLAQLYFYSYDDDDDALRKQAQSVLYPKCPQCHRNDLVEILSPSPRSSIEEELKSGWWSCGRCERIKGTGAFQAKNALTDP
jgi:hypothetical protein